MLLFWVLFASIIVASFFGHLVHWSLHQAWTGPAHRGHMAHHTVHYPPGNMVSETYRTSHWSQSGTLLFTPPLLIILGALGGLMWWAGAPLWAVGVQGVAMVSFGLLNDFMHDSYHVRKHWLLRFRGYRHLRKMHFLHHHDMTINLGIVNHAWDRAFGTRRVGR
jgi:hypothetical protein